MSRAPTEQEFDEWRSHPVTRSVMEMLFAKREQMRQDWEGGSFSDYLKDAMILVNVGNLGTCKGYAFVTDLEYETLIGELEHGKHEWVEASGSRGADSSV